MPILIHGRKYFTVAERLKEAQKSGNLVSIETQYLPHETKVICRAIIRMKNGGTFMGTSAADPSKNIERNSPYEVAETSAVGRALAFAGFKVTDGIASADEMQKQEAETFPASMYDLNSAAEKINQLIALEHNEDQRIKLNAVSKGLTEAKTGKRELTKAYVRDIIDRATLKIREKTIQLDASEET